MPCLHCECAEVVADSLCIQLSSPPLLQSTMCPPPATQLFVMLAMPTALQRPGVPASHTLHCKRWSSSAPVGTGFLWGFCSGHIELPEYLLKHPHQPQCKYIDSDRHHQEKNSTHCNESKIALIHQFSNVPDIILSTSYQDSPLVFHSLRVHYFLGRWNPHIVVVCHAGLNARNVFPKPRRLRSGA